ncbi:hypothetical protein CEXT_67061 [Caerostris extrusa]|uniref:Uncharacterized protein n=1 Tax=Caerostris extrusa TaxID=172846 RepID=A0AAV4XBH3_CAEEX|nr:hypothetical protein CEXT_67061 [Caerostris extrusa]
MTGEVPLEKNRLMALKIVWWAEQDSSSKGFRFLGLLQSLQQRGRNATGCLQKLRFSISGFFENVLLAEK